MKNEELVVVSIKLTKDQLIKLDALAYRRRTTRSALVREIIQKYLNEENIT